ncbi:EAL domain-containing protein [Vibrio sp. dsl-7]|uniref:EAL domain-containing protein n=1 Tax=Vibrio chanodichtyis TaxID=3027932 RepID=A0ABT5V1R1_9VIBR|nr:EAL domain-containing protein [Vibrio chanodichtyis]MDE1515388.1 EAL domain-containing protein [Vibrio chanodichtyis]
MVLTDKRLVLDSIYYDEDGEYYARYNGLTLRSVFQPIFDKQHQVVGAEALVRIYTQQRTQIRPDLFFHSDAFAVEDKLNVERLSRAIHIRNFNLSVYRDTRLFLNLLPIAGEQFADGNISTSQLAIQLAKLNIPHQRVVMELLEVESSDEQRLQIATAQLAASGFQIAIDDFGCRASTPARVAMLRPNIIKLDRQLLLDYMVGNCTGLLTGLQLARSSGADTVVEGIETAEQLAAMRKLNIHMYQGYYLGLPEGIAQAAQVANTN